MFDLHCHILPEIDDGADSLETACEMARRHVDQGVTVVACTPHILPGLYHNDGPQILAAVERLRAALGDADIALELVGGADNHVRPDFVPQLQSGHLLAIGGTRYVLVEPPHHVAPARLEDMFFGILASGYVPILTHPERLTWIEQKYDTMVRLAERGVWMQITSGSLLGRFGRRARYWGERMLCEGHVRLLASDAHDVHQRPPDLEKGARAAEKLVGRETSEYLVTTAPRHILLDHEPSSLADPVQHDATSSEGSADVDHSSDRGALRGFLSRRLQRYFG